MKNFQPLRLDTWNFFTGTSEQRQAFFSKIKSAEQGELQESVAYFSQFDENHLNIAKSIWTKLFDIANGNDQDKNDHQSIENPDVRLERAINYIKSIDQNPDLKEYALMVFITHNETARKILHGTIPSIMVRNPLKIIPSANRNNFGKTISSYTIRQGGNTDPNEDRLNYFREDPLFNEHHEHWHVVYPNGGIPFTDKKGNVSNKERERHGEMFIYMHQQMLAHYDAHRLAVSLPKTVPYDFTTPVEVGYDPGMFVNQFGDMAYSPREANWAIKTVIDYTVTQQLTYIYRLQKAIECGYVESNTTKIKLNADLIGMLIESLGGSVEQFGELKNFYGNIHNKGHNLLSNAPGLPAPLGVMCQTTTSIRDHVFFRWHRRIDDYSFTWQETQNPNDFSDAPNVLIRNGFDYSPDIIICQMDDVANTGKQLGLSSKEIGYIGFGNNNWNKDFTAGFADIPSKTQSVKPVRLFTHAVIENYFSQGQINITDPVQPGSTLSIPYEYMNHKSYCFYIRIENKMPVRSKVTIRVFIVPKDLSNDRRMWIELDKFTHDLLPNAKDVIFRRDLDAAIIRKPAIINPSVENIMYRPLAATDMEIFYSQGLVAAPGVGYLPILKKIALAGGDPTDPTLVDLYIRFLIDPPDPSVAENIRMAAFKSILDKFFNNLTIGWEELQKITNKEFQEKSVLVDKLYQYTKHHESTNEIVGYYSSLKSFIAEQACLIDFFKETLLIELNAAMLRAFQRVIDLAYCDCGLPYNILYPRGTREGQDYYFMVMATDWNKDISGYENCCGSMSYCGTRTNYPDIREMGYPFNRPFKSGVLNAMAALDNVAIRQMKIQLVDEPK